MYGIVTLRDKVRIEPSKFEEDPKTAVSELIRKDYLGKILEERMIVIGLVSVENIEEGIIIPNDASIYYDTTFKALTYMPMLHETVKGQISNISEIGAMINIGPLDGLAHISQTMDDFVDFSKTSLIGRKSRVILKTGDTVLGSIIAISTKGIMKVGLTMRSPGLGKLGAKRKEEKVRGKKNDA